MTDKWIRSQVTHEAALLACLEKAAGHGAGRATAGLMLLWVEEMEVSIHRAE